MAAMEEQLRLLVGPPGRRGEAPADGEVAQPALPVESRSEREEVAPVEADQVQPAHGPAPADWWEREPEPVRVESPRGERHAALQRLVARAANAPRRTPSHAMTRQDLESRIGGFVFAALGAIIVTFGVGFFLKYAYDQGWLALIPPAAKCLIGAAFGLVLIGAGEIVFRRWGKVPATGLAAAGVSAVYASALSAYAVYELISAPTGFALLMLAVALAVGIAIRSGTLAMAVLAIAGGYLTPFVTRIPSPSPYVLPAHLAAMLALGLVLSGWRPKPFRTLRAIVFIATIALGGIWAMVEAPQLPVLVLAFLAIVWAALHAEALFAARDEPPTGEEAEELAAAGRLRPRIHPAAWSIVVSLVATTWATMLGILAMRELSFDGDWLVPAAGFTVTCVLWMMLAGHLRLFAERPRTTREQLGAALAAQSAALLIVAVAMGVDGWLQVAIWAAIGLAAAFSARAVGSLAVALYAMALLAIGSMRVVSPDVVLAAMALGSAERLGLIWSWWMGLAAVTGVAWHIAAQLLVRGGHRGAGGQATACAAAGTVLLAGAFVHVEAEPLSLAAAWLVLSWLLVAASRFLRRVGIAFHAGGVLTIGTLAWAPALPHTGVGEHLVGLLIAASWFAAAVALLRRAEASPREAAPVLAFIGTAVLLGASWHGAAPAWWNVGMLGVISLGVTVAHVLERRLRFDEIGMGAFAATIAALVSQYPPERWFASEVGAWRHPAAWLCVLLGGLLACAGLWLWRGPQRGRSERAQYSVWASVALLFAGSSLEVARSADLLAESQLAASGALTLWWVGFAIAMLVGGWILRKAAARWVGLGLLGVCAAKALLFDLSTLEMVWRIVSFLALGLVLLAVAVAYAAISGGARRPSRRREGDEGVDAGGAV